MKPFISIIIPAYNVEKYIGECMQSINNQTFIDYEVIIVNDGSTDNTLHVIDKYKNEKYKVISQKNSGAGMARNTGINLCTGDYIGFMDADDFLYNDDCLQDIVKTIKSKNCDMITYKMIRFYQKHNKFLIEDDILINKESYSNSISYLKDSIGISRLSVSPCDKIVKSKIIKNNKVLFKKMVMLEDIDWSLELYKYISSVYIYNKPIYVYRKQRENSTTSFYTKHKVEACLQFIENWCKQCQNKNDEFSILCLNYIAYQYTILLAAVNRKNSTKKIRNKLKDYVWLLDYTMNFKTKKASIIYKIFGYNTMIIILKTYMWLKNKNLILIR